MRRSRAKRKRETLKKVARSVQLFYPELRDIFLCPACLRRVPIQDASEVSHAHILPRVAGGGLRTLLCRKCNSTFGKIQDKWFGEYLRLLDAPDGPLSATQQHGHFEVGGQRVNGRYRVSPDGNIQFLVFKNRNSPKVLGALEKTAAQARLRGSLEVKFQSPLLGNKQLVNCGFVTAAYLLWFRELGYSWALQNHLDTVREQIANPHERILPAAAIASSPNHFFDKPSIGTCRIGGELALCAGLGDRLVFFAPTDSPNLYESLPSSFKGMRADDLKFVSFGWQRCGFPGPLAVVCGERLVVAPDVFVRGAVDVPVMVFPTDGGDPRTLYPVSDEEYAQRLKLPRTLELHIRPNLRPPSKDTGR